MASCKKMYMDSPRQGIMKSIKNMGQDKPKQQKRIKLDVLKSKKTISIQDAESISSDNHENATQKGELITIKSIGETGKKGCLKNADNTGLTGLSPKKIAAVQDGEMADLKSSRSTKSIKFNDKTNVYVYRKEGQKSVDRVKRFELLKNVMKQKPVLVQAVEEDQCCVIF